MGWLQVCGWGVGGGWGQGQDCCSKVAVGWSRLQSLQASKQQERSCHPVQTEQAVGLCGRKAFHVGRLEFPLGLTCAESWKRQGPWHPQAQCCVQLPACPVQTETHLKSRPGQRPLPPSSTRSTRLSSLAMALA